MSGTLKKRTTRYLDTIPLYLTLEFRFNWETSHLWLVQDVVLLWVLQRFNKNTTRSESEFYLIDTIKIRVED